MNHALLASVAILAMASTACARSEPKSEEHVSSEALLSFDEFAAFSSEADYQRAVRFYNQLSYVHLLSRDYAPGSDKFQLDVTTVNVSPVPSFEITGKFLKARSRAPSEIFCSRPLSDGTAVCTYTEQRREMMDEMDLFLSTDLLETIHPEDLPISSYLGFVREDFDRVGMELSDADIEKANELRSLNTYLLDCYKPGANGAEFYCKSSARDGEAEFISDYFRQADLEE